MGILERTRHIIRANLNDLLQKAKNPEVVLDAYIDDLETVLAEAESICSIENTERGIYAAKLRDLKNSKKTWEQKAKNCLKQGDEDLARAALERKLDNAEKEEELEDELEQRKASLTILQESVEILKERIRDVRRHRRNLVFKKQLYQARSELQASISRLGHNKDEPTKENASESLNSLEGHLEAYESIHRENFDDRFLRLEIAERKQHKSDAIENELKELQRQLKKKKN
jgi:phage shock protein A